jgi:hypothetical protein
MIAPRILFTTSAAERRRAWLVATALRRGAQFIAAGALALGPTRLKPARHHLPLHEQRDVCAAPTKIELRSHSRSRSGLPQRSASDLATSTGRDARPRPTACHPAAHGQRR